MKKLIAGFVGLAMVVMVVAPVGAGAQTVADLTAQINGLLATIASLQAQLASMQGGSSGGSYVFSANLTLGSTGADVSALQQYLVSKGYLTMPAGVAMGYFGPLTQAAVASWQAANGIAPAVGYFGPISRAALNLMMASTGGTTGGGTTVHGSTTGITTPGVEGTLTASLNPSPASGKTVREGDTNEDVLGIKLEAKLSDIKVERIKLNLGTASSFYTKVFRALHVADGSNVLASVDLNSSTVVKEGTTYYITITGFDFVVPKDATKVLTIKADLHANIDSTGSGSCDDVGDTACTITVPVDGVRGIDGAGINQYSPSATFARSLTIGALLSDTAELKLALNTNTPVTQEIVAAQGTTDDEYDGLSVMTFDISAEKDDVLVTDFTLAVTEGGAGSNADTVTAYLYDGSTLVGSASVTAAATAYAIFSDIDFTVPEGTTKTLTVKLDIRSADSTGETINVSATSTSATAENSEGSAVTPTGSATGKTFTVRNVGPVFTLLSKTIAKDSGPAITGATSTAVAKFVVRAQAVGGDIYFGNNATTAAYRMFNATAFDIWQNGAVVLDLTEATSTAFTQPSTGVTAVGTNTFKLAENNTVDVTVEHTLPGRTPGGVLIALGSYAIGIQGITWSPDEVLASYVTSTFMDGEGDWRTTTVTLP